MSPQSTTSQSVERKVSTGIKKCAPGTPAKTYEIATTLRVMTK